MRLIDIDKVVSDYKAKNKSLQNVTWFELTDYEVKAIPIEWIENWKSGKTSIEQVVADKIMMDYKYKDYWEKENEID